MLADAITVTVKTGETDPASRANFQRRIGSDSQYSVYQDLTVPNGIFKKGLISSVDLRITG